MSEDLRSVVFVVDGEPVELVRRNGTDELWGRGRQLLISGRFRKSERGSAGTSRDDITMRGVITTNLSWLVTVWSGAGGRPLRANNGDGRARFTLSHEMSGAAYGTSVHSYVEGTLEIDLAAGTAEIDIFEHVDLSE